MAGTLFIISAPSGTGKTSLVNALIEKVDNMAVSISYTTRNIRTGETDGINYNFISIETFQDMIKQDLFLEYAKVFDNYYGTAHTWVIEKLNVNIDLILEIDWQGAIQVRKKFQDAISIFILPPSIETLQQRLINRKQDELEVIQQRMQQVKSEITHYNEYDYLIINNHFEKALEDLITIVKTSRLKTNKQALLLKNLLACLKK